MTIKVRYSSVDGFSQTRTFKTLAGAQKYAAKWVGPSPDVGGWYAVSFDGVGKVEASVPMTTLFPALAEQAGPTTPDEDSDWEGPSRYT